MGIGELTKKGALGLRLNSLSSLWGFRGFGLRGRGARLDTTCSTPGRFWYIIGFRVSGPYISGPYSLPKVLISYPVVDQTLISVAISPEPPTLSPLNCQRALNPAP